MHIGLFTPSDFIDDRNVFLNIYWETPISQTRVFKVSSIRVWLCFSYMFVMFLFLPQTCFRTLDLSLMSLLEQSIEQASDSEVLLSKKHRSARQHAASLLKRRRQQNKQQKLISVDLETPAGRYQTKKFPQPLEIYLRDFCANNL